VGPLPLHPRRRIHPGSRCPSRSRPPDRTDRKKELAAMLFRIVSAVSLLGLAGRLTYLRFRHDTVLAGAQTGSLSRAAYFRWLRRGSGALFHCVAGGLFAVSLAADVIIRAKEYGSIIEVFTSGGRPMAYLVGLFSRPLRQSLLYWVFVIAGLDRVSTALFSMLPYFSFRTQLGLVETHRWSALAAALSAMAFFDSVLPRKET